MLDIVQVEFPFPILEALPLHAFGARLLLDEHGVETDFLHEILTSIGKSPMSLESAQVSFLERLAVQAASSVLCCSEHDKARIMDLYGGRSSKFLVVENGIEDEFFQPVEPFKFPDPTVLFLGSFNHSPNLYAIDWIVQQVVPRVQRIAPKTKFVFVGSGSVELPRVNESMVIRDVKDVRPYIRGAQVGLATVFHGSGSRLKILEYSACGLPVIASTKGIEGLDLEPDSEVLVANDPDSVATAIIELLTDRYLAMQLAANAQAKVRSKHSWLTIASKALPAYSP
jgi:glycosyltransferase involved in cell wall biosynthesis